MPDWKYEDELRIETAVQEARGTWTSPNREPYRHVNICWAYKCRETTDLTRCRQCKRDFCIAHMSPFANLCLECGPANQKQGQPTSSSQNGKTGESVLGLFILLGLTYAVPLVLFLGLVYGVIHFILKYW